MSLELQHVDYIYDPGGAYETQALTDINLKIERGEMIGMIGQTGSGKSTLLQVLGGLIRPTGGVVLSDGKNIYDRDFSMRDLRKTIGIVFQYPEYQLFESTVLKDVCFGPKNLGYSREEAEEKAERGLRLAKLPESYWNASPFELSGGEKRRAAIAGVLAMEPQMLVLDEPTAGLDPRGRKELFSMITDLHENGMTLLLVSHSMDDVAEYTERLIVLNHGSVFLDGPTAEVFSHREELENIHLALPEMAYLMQDLADCGFSVDTTIIRLEDARKEILKLC